jgi:hypothetical protein
MDGATMDGATVEDGSQSLRHWLGLTSVRQSGLGLSLELSSGSWDGNSCGLHPPLPR